MSFFPLSDSLELSNICQQMKTKGVKSNVASSKGPLHFRNKGCFVYLSIKGEKMQPETKEIRNIESTHPKNFQT